MASQHLHPPQVRWAEEHLESPGKEHGSSQLVKFNMNLSQLNDYLQSIIKVVNQHAKLLKNLNTEVQSRPSD